LLIFIANNAKITNHNLLFSQKPQPPKNQTITLITIPKASYSRSEGWTKAGRRQSEGWAKGERRI